MKIRAKVGFCGAISMAPGEERECDNEVVLQDLFGAGYIEEVAPVQQNITEDSQEQEETKEDPVQEVTEEEQPKKRGAKGESK